MWFKKKKSHWLCFQHSKRELRGGLVLSLPPIFYFEIFQTYRKVTQIIQSAPLYPSPRLTNC